MIGKFIDVIPLMPVLSEEERAVQNKVKEIAERCMDLQADAMRRLRPEQRRPLYLVCVCENLFAGSFLPILPTRSSLKIFCFVRSDSDITLVRSAVTGLHCTCV